MRIDGQSPDGLCSKLVAGCWAFSVSVFTALTQDHLAAPRKKDVASCARHLPPSPLTETNGRSRGEGQSSGDGNTTSHPQTRPSLCGRSDPRDLAFDLARQGGQKGPREGTAKHQHAHGLNGAAASGRRRGPQGRVWLWSQAVSSRGLPLVSPYLPKVCLGSQHSQKLDPRQLCIHKEDRPM